MNIIKHTLTLPSLFYDNMFQGFFSPVVHSNSFNRDNKFPTVDIDETEDHYMLLAEVPGFKK
jgi:HSP20 family protein